MGSSTEQTKQEPTFEKIWEDCPGARYMHLGTGKYPVIRQYYGNGWELVGWVDGTKVMSYKSIKISGPYGRAFTNEEYEIINCASTEDAIKFAKEYFKVVSIE